MLADKKKEVETEEARKKAKRDLSKEKLNAVRAKALQTVNDLKEIVAKDAGEWLFGRNSLQKKHLSAVFTLVGQPLPKVVFKLWLDEVKIILAWDAITKSFSADTPSANAAVDDAALQASLEDDDVRLDNDDDD